MAWDKTSRNVLLAFPHPGTVRTEFMMSVFDQGTSEDSLVASVLAFPTGPVLSKARNQIARQFLATDHEWLWMIDTDIIFTRKTLPALLDIADPDETPVVSALFNGRPEGEDMPIAYGAGKDSEGRFKFGFLRPEQIGDKGAVIQVAAVGTGCILIHRNAFERISKHNPGDDGLWFCEMVVDGDEFGEDMSFCMRLALAEVPLLLHTGVRVGHVKSQMLGVVSP
jgi:hypothetical protein